MHHWKCWIVACLVAVPAGAQANADSAGQPRSATTILSKVSGDGQLVQANWALNAPLVIRATDGAGNPLAGLTVTWTGSTGLMFNSPISTTTDAGGLAQVTFAAAGNFNPGVGWLTFTATATCAGTSVSFSVTAYPSYAQGSSPPTIHLLAPSQAEKILTARIGTRLNAIVVTSVTTGGGNSVSPGIPIPGVGTEVYTGYSDPALGPVVGCAGGTVFSAADGTATCDLIVSGQPGTTGLTVNVGNNTLFNDLQINAQPAAVAIPTIISGDNQSTRTGQPFANPLVVKLADSLGTPLPGTVATWQVVTPGSLTLSGTTSAADASGLVTSNVTAGASAGNYQVTVSAGAQSVTFHLTVQATATTLTKFSGDGQSGTLVGQTFPAPLVVAVLDAQAQPVSGVGIGWTVTQGSATLSATGTTTGSDGHSQVTVTAGAAAGAIRVTASASGLASVVFSLTSAAVSGSATIVVTPNRLNFAVKGAAMTPPQTVTVSISGATGVHWSVASSQPNIVAAPASGTGSGVFTVTASDGPGGTLTVSAPGASNSAVLSVNISPAAGGAPIGVFETPSATAGTLAGSVAVTGWALDSVGLASLKIWREPVYGETGTPNGLVFIGDAVFVPGARPDVESAYPAYPQSNRAGWGYLMLTNSLPLTTLFGTAVHKLHAIATNTQGQITDLGTRTIIVNNGGSLKPFGSFGTPAQGATVNGAAYANQGWALTPRPALIPADGSTITVFIDGVALGHPTYGLYRADIATLFSGYGNANAAGASFALNTTTLVNGMHSIAWSVRDDAGHADGIGSRYFFVLNSTSAAQPAPVVEPASTAPADAWFATGSAGHAGRTLGLRPGLAAPLRLRELERIELRLPARPSGVTWSGALEVNGQAQALPVGSTLDGRAGVFCWQLGPGFHGDFLLVFSASDGSPQTRQHVRIE